LEGDFQNRLKFCDCPAYGLAYQGVGIRHASRGLFFHRSRGNGGT
jgi:hypothetical protein